MNDFTTSFSVDQTADEAYAAINNVRLWWTGDVEGSTDKLGDEFTYRFEDIHYSKQKVTQLIPGRKIVWLVLDSKLNFVKDKTEWTGTEMTFDIARRAGKTEVSFTHRGLVPEFECFDDCSNAWGGYINSSLRNLITTAKSLPNQTDAVQVARDHDFTTTFSVDKTSNDAFDALTNVRGWWSEEIEGSTDRLNDEFVY